MNDLLRALTNDPTRLLAMYRQFESLMRTTDISENLRSETNAPAIGKAEEEGGDENEKKSHPGGDFPNRQPCSRVCASRFLKCLELLSDEEFERDSRRRRGCRFLDREEGSPSLEVDDRVQVFLSSFRLETHAVIHGRATVVWSGQPVSLESPGDVVSRAKKVLIEARADWNAICFGSATEKNLQHIGTDLNLCQAVVRLFALERPESSVFIEGVSPNVEDVPLVLYQFEPSPGNDWNRVAKETSDLEDLVLARMKSQLSSKDRLSWSAIESCLSRFSELSGEKRPGRVLDIFVCVNRKPVEARSWCWSRRSWEAEFPALRDPVGFGTRRPRQHRVALPGTNNSSDRFNIWPITLSPIELDRANLNASQECCHPNTEDPWWLECLNPS